MEKTNPEDILVLPPAYKLYKDSTIGIATFLGGPLIAGYLTAENFKQLDNTRSARMSWIISILATIVIFGSIFFLPLPNMPSYVIPLIYSTIARVLVQKYQGAAIRAHLDAGGQLHSVWRGVFISLIGLIITVALLLGLSFMTDVLPILHV